MIEPRKLTPSQRLELCKLGLNPEVPQNKIGNFTSAGVVKQLEAEGAVVFLDGFYHQQDSDSERGMVSQYPIEKAAVLYGNPVSRSGEFNYNLEPFLEHFDEKSFRVKIPGSFELKENGGVVIFTEKVGTQKSRYDHFRIVPMHVRDSVVLTDKLARDDVPETFAKEFAQAYGFATAEDIDTDEYLGRVFKPKRGLLVELHVEKGSIHSMGTPDLKLRISNVSDSTHMKTPDTLKNHHYVTDSEDGFIEISRGVNQISYLTHILGCYKFNFFM